MIGQTLGHYRIEEKLGEGGMGVVYRARDTHLDRPVAIKVLPAETVANPERKRRFVQEAKSASALNHPNIIHIYDIDADQGVDYIAMEYVAGETLDRLIGPEGIPVDAALQHAIQIADALAKAHAAGIVHRDLKPANIMVTGDGHVKVLDFGLAKLFEREQAADSASTRTSPMTEEGAIIGTAAYMSPEQAQGLKVDARSDIFAFGAVLYEMLTGRRAFQGQTKLAILTAVLHQEPRPLEGAPAELENMLACCLRKDPARRIGHMDEVKRALEDLKEKPASSRVVAPAPRRPRARWAAVAAAAALVVAATAWWFVSHRSQPIDSLAVLPFVNAGGDPNTEYLSEGISESLITGLSRVPHLKVKSRDTVFRYKGQDKDAQQVGRDLSVRAVLKGRLVQRGGSLSISAELVDTSDGNLLWRDQYNRRAADILATEQEISREITRQLRLRLTGEEQHRVAASPTGSPEAYRLYIQGRYWWNRRTEESLRKSAEFFQQAIEKDPGYAPAWAGLADAFLLLGERGMPPAEAFPKARAAADRAIELDGTLAEPHASLAHLKEIYEWDWPGAQREFQRAIDLNPEYGTAHHWYAFYLAEMGRFPEALAEIRRARELEPLSPIINSAPIILNYYARQYDRAAQEAGRILEMDPSFFMAHVALGQTYTLQRKPQEAQAELELALQLDHRSAFTLAYAGATAAFSGRREEARKLLQELLDLSRRRRVEPHFLAVIYANLGEKDRAFEFFDRALQERYMRTHFLLDPLLDGIRSDPRFQSMLQRMGLPP